MLARATSVPLQTGSGTPPSNRPFSAIRTGGMLDTAGFQAKMYGMLLLDSMDLIFDLPALIRRQVRQCPLQFAKFIRFHARRHLLDSSRYEVYHKSKMT
jgi:hypothetical protein